MQTNHYEEPEWMKKARQAPLYSQPSDRNHQSRLLPGQSRGNAKPAPSK